MKMKVSREERKMKENAYEGLKDLVEYLQDHPRSFTNVLGKQRKLFLVGLGYEIIDFSARLTNWIIVPYIYDKLYYDQVKSNFKELEIRFENWIDEKVKATSTTAGFPMSSSAPSNFRTYV